MRRLILLPCLFVSQILVADEQLWTDIEPSYQFRSASAKVGTFHKARKLKLNSAALIQQLTNVDKSILEGDIIELPLADGTQMLFKFEPSKVMAPELAARYPGIKTWRIYNPENPAVTGRIDIGPQGFHGLINTADGDRIFIDPENNDGDEIYTSLSRRSNQDSIDNDFQCEVHQDSAIQAKPELTFPSTTYKTLSNPADSLLTYRVAIATTGEYTQLFGGSKEDAMAAIVTTVNRLNQVYERDLSIHLQLVGNNDDLIYTNPNSDPYTNEDASAMVDENIININSVIGNDNYDLGHVFGTGNTGGLAFLDSACGTYKAGGVTGSNSPSGDAFNIDYVAHEIGHQLGASHTFNGHQLNCSAGNRAGNTAVEPGSGSSIMGYAGICGTDNLQTHSDAFFHTASINQIFNYTRNSGGSKCGTVYETTNNKPTVNAGSDYTIPASTPFMLMGETSDADDDSLLHSWEQIDTGSAGGLYTDLGSNPLFRIWPPVSGITRFFPALADELSGTTSIGEILPTTTRTMNFNLLARDNNGGVGHDQMKVNVVNTGLPFAVTSPSKDMTLSAGQTLPVTWDVAETNLSPINCSSVAIKLLENNGSMIELLASTSNDGAEMVTIPSDVVSIIDAHLKVACNDNIFFAVSRGQIQILGGSPILSANSPSITEEDTGTRNLSFILTLSAFASENVIIDYEITDQSTDVMVQRGQTFIAKGSRNVSIQVPVAGDTLFEDNQIFELAIDKPANAQFVSGSSSLTTQGIIIDDDTVIAANPGTNTDSSTATSSASSSGGGGSMGLFSLLSIFLLVIRRHGLRTKS